MGSAVRGLTMGCILFCLFVKNFSQHANASWLQVYPWYKFEIVQRIKLSHQSTQRHFWFFRQYTNYVIITHLWHLHLHVHLGLLNKTEKRTRVKKCCSFYSMAVLDMYQLTLNEIFFNRAIVAVNIKLMGRWLLLRDSHYKLSENNSLNACAKWHKLCKNDEFRLHNFFVL